MKIGITGGIGCGKSTALLAFHKHNFVTLDADAIGHRLLDTEQAREFVSKNFGEHCIYNGSVNRAELAKIIFSNPDARMRLERFIHPQIESSWRTQMEEAKLAGKNIAVEIPLLFEKGYEREFDKTVCIFCSLQKQLERLESRGLARESARARIAAQLPLPEKIKNADFCIYNDGDEKFLDEQIAILTQQLQQTCNTNNNI